MIRFLHISDTHFGPTKEFIIHGKNPYNDSLKLVEFVRSLPCQVDFVMHTGDVVSFQDPAAYKLAEEVLKAIPDPIYFVTGNHDDPKFVRSFPLFAPKTDFKSTPNAACYTFEAGDLLGVVLDVKHPDNSVPSGVLTKAIYEELEQILSTHKKRFALFAHFPFIPFDTPWMDQNLLVDKGEDLHKLIVRSKERCAGVFLGHIHQATAVSRDGVNYYSAPSSSFLFGGWPIDIECPSHNPQGLPGCNLVTIDEGKTVVKFLHYPRA